MGGIKIHELSDQYVIDSIINIDEGNENLSEIGFIYLFIFCG